MSDSIAPNEPRLMIVLMSGTWLGISRLPKALSMAGFRVATFCHDTSFLSRTRYAERTFKAPTAGDLFAPLVAAARQYKPDMIIPGCESSVHFLHEIVHAGSDGRLDQTVQDVVELARRSLGAPAYYRATLSKHETLRIAARLGLRTPQQSFISGVEDAMRCADEYGYPLVIKGEFGSGGSGVRICGTRDKIAEAFHSLNASGASSLIVAQQYIHGTAAMQTAIAIAGEMLESLTFQKERCHPQPAGPGSVVRHTEHAEAKHAASALIREYGYTGFGHCDFIIENETGAAFLLEFNPRPSPVCHLGWLFGQDLCRALWCRLAGTTYRRQPPASDYRTVALFPSEWSRDPQSHFLTQAYHDIPEDDPALLDAFIRACT
ncbi:MAG: ATP-grasp domain-containing protein [Nitrosomonadales bacterium]|nr:ATP-grasp domain-containing protein [Nitrosomonadales bacterium]